jgi:predicted MFS family arabinose efflux permease
LAWLLAGYGVAGLIAMAAMARPLDHWPKASVVACLAALAAALAALTTLAFDSAAGTLTVLVGVAAMVLWGAASTALPPMLQASAMRTSPEDPDGASGRYVAAFQVGIMAGSLVGGVLFDNAGLAVMIAASAALIVVAMVGVLATRDVFKVSCATTEK